MEVVWLIVVVSVMMMMTMMMTMVVVVCWWIQFDWVQQHLPIDHLSPHSNKVDIAVHWPQTISSNTHDTQYHHTMESQVVCVDHFDCHRTRWNTQDTPLIIDWQSQQQQQVNQQKTNTAISPVDHKYVKQHVTNLFVDLWFVIDCMVHLTSQWSFVSLLFLEMKHIYAWIGQWCKRK